MAYFDLTAEENVVFVSVDEEFKRLEKRINSCYNGDSLIVIDINKLRKAWKVAKYWHRDTRRKSGELYLYHPLAVCKKMFNDGFMDIDALVAALLHDTVEDTEYTLEQLTEDFGANACELVKAVTKFEATKDPADAMTKKQAQTKTDEHLLQVAKEHPFAAYIKFADRWHNLHTCQKMSEASILKNVAHTKTVLIPVARKLGCNKIAEELIDSCMLAQFPIAYENIFTAQKAFINNSRKSITKTINAMRSSCARGASIDSVEGRIDLPLPYIIAAEIRDSYKNANLKRQDLFSFYSYRPYAMVYFKINEPTDDSLEHQFLHLCRNLIANNTISIESEFRDRDVEDTSVAYVDITDMYHNKLRVVVYSKDFRNTIVEHYGLKLTPATILPPEKRIRIFTRDGKQMEVEKGCAVLDFAFILKTDIGIRYNGAKVNGKPVEMDYIIQPGDQITIIKSDEPTACLDWFKVLETKTAVSRLVEWMKVQAS